MPSMLDLPQELLDELIFHIPAPQDLLSLALASHALLAAATDHLKWRRICLPESDMATLAHLASNKRSARMVHRIAVNETGQRLESERVMEEFTPAVSTTQRRLSGYRALPFGIARGDEDELSRVRPLDLEDVHRRAAENCSILEEIRLKVYDLKPWKGFFAGLKARDVLETGHGQGGRLKTVEIVEEPGPMGWALADAIEVIDLLGGQEDFSWASATIAQATELIHLITDFLITRCQDLRTLSLYIFSTINPVPSAHPLFLSRFPSLRCVSLGHVRTSEAIGPFLDAHPSLERVSIQCAGHADVILSPSAVPKVREFDVVWLNSPQLYEQVCAPLPSGGLRPLEQLSITAGAYREPGSINGLCEHLRLHKGIKAIRWEDTSMQLSSRLQSVGEALQGVRTLSILAFYLDRRLPEIADALRPFRRLEQILIGRGRLEPTHCLTLHEACPTLRRIGPWEWRELSASQDGAGTRRYSWVRRLADREWGLGTGP